MKCANCGAPLQPGWLACPNCGLAFEQPVPRPDVKVSPGMPVSMMICVGLFVIIGISVFIAVIANHRIGDQGTGNASSEPYNQTHSMTIADVSNGMSLGQSFRDIFIRYGPPDRTFANNTAHTYNCSDGRVTVVLYQDPVNQIPEMTPSGPGAMRPAWRVQRIMVTRNISSDALLSRISVGESVDQAINTLGPPDSEEIDMSQNATYIYYNCRDGRVGIKTSTSASHGIIMQASLGLRDLATQGMPQ